MESLRGDRRTLAGLLIACVLLIVAVVAAFSGHNANADEAKKVIICHETDSVTNPYVTLTVDADSVDLDTTNDQGTGDHNAEHNGPTFDPEHEYTPPIDDDDWGDIIPPFYEDGSDGPWPAKNWDELGMAIFEAGCAIPVTTTTSSSTTSTSTSTTSTSTSTTSTTIVGPSLFAFGAAGTECQAEVPVILITFANTFPELAGEVGVLTVTALADDSVIGDVEVIYQPNTTVEFLYPGAEVDENGNIVDLPGWTLQDNGLWVIDESDAFLREGLLLTYTVGEETATAEVTYPPESSLCANPPENPPVIPPVVPPVDVPPVIVPVPPGTPTPVAVTANPEFTG